MRLLGKLLIGILFTLLLLIFIILGTVRFEILNTSFLFGSFERHGVYEKLPQVLADSLPNDPEVPQEERGEYAKIAQSIKPEIVKRIIEGSFSQIIAYTNGKSDEIKISVPVREMGLGETDIQWSSSSVAVQETMSSFELLHGIGNKILIAWFVILLILGLLFWVYGKNRKRLILISGVIVTTISIAARLFSLLMEKSMPDKLEPSQALLKLMASSLFADITMTWIVFGILLLVGYFVIRALDRRLENK